MAIKNYGKWQKNGFQDGKVLTSEDLNGKDRALGDTTKDQGGEDYYPEGQAAISRERDDLSYQILSQGLGPKFSSGASNVVLGASSWKVSLDSSCETTLVETLRVPVSKGKKKDDPAIERFINFNLPSNFSSSIDLKTWGSPTEVVSLTSEDATTTYVEGVDYEVLKDRLEMPQSTDLYGEDGLLEPTNSWPAIKILANTRRPDGSGILGISEGQTLKLTFKASTVPSNLLSDPVFSDSDNATGGYTRLSISAGEGFINGSRCYSSGVSTLDVSPQNFWRPQILVAYVKNASTSKEIAEGKPIFSNSFSGWEVGFSLVADESSMPLTSFALAWVTFNDAETPINRLFTSFEGSDSATNQFTSSSLIESTYRFRSNVRTVNRIYDIRYLVEGGDSELSPLTDLRRSLGGFRDEGFSAYKAFYSFRDSLSAIATRLRDVSGVDWTSISDSLTSVNNKFVGSNVLGHEHDATSSNSVKIKASSFLVGSGFKESAGLGLNTYSRKLWDRWTDPSDSIYGGNNLQNILAAAAKELMPNKVEGLEFIWGKWRIVPGSKKDPEIDSHVVTKDYVDTTIGTDSKIWVASTTPIDSMNEGTLYSLASSTFTVPANSNIKIYKLAMERPIEYQCNFYGGSGTTTGTDLLRFVFKWYRGGVLIRTINIENDWSGEFSSRVLSLPYSKFGHSGLLKVPTIYDVHDVGSSSTSLTYEVKFELDEVPKSTSFPQYLCRTSLDTWNYPAVNPDIKVNFRGTANPRRSDSYGAIVNNQTTSSNPAKFVVVGIA